MKSLRLRMTRRSGVAALAAATLLVMLAGGRPDPSQAQTAGKTFTFGALFPMTGPAAEIGQDFVRGLDLATDAVNARGGVDGWKLKSIVVDHKGNAQGGVQAMNQLVNLDKVPFAMTSFAGVGLAAQPIAAQNQVLLLNVGGTSLGLLDKPWLYNDQIIGEPLNAPLAQYAWDHGKRTAALLTSEDPFGKDNGASFVSAFTKLGGKIVESETFPLGSSDFSSQLAKIKAANPAVLYSVAVGDTQGLLASQSRAADIKALMLGPLVTMSLITTGGRASEGFIGAGIAVDPNTKDSTAKAFIAAFRAKYGRDPEWGSGTPYEGVLYLATLIHEVVRSGGDPRSGAALLKAVEAHPSFQNVLSGGTVTLLKDHGSTRAIALTEVRDAKFVTIKVVQPPK